jgi:hypothetical protein
MGSHDRALVINVVGHARGLTCLQRLHRLGDRPPGRLEALPGRVVAVLVHIVGAVTDIAEKRGVGLHPLPDSGHDVGVQPSGCLEAHLGCRRDSGRGPPDTESSRQY